MPKQSELQKRQEQVLVGDMQVLSATGELFNHVDNELPMWAGDGDRKVSVEISFKNAFAAPPAITLGLSGIDSAHDQNLRFWLSATNVSEQGFTVTLQSWGDTHIARAAISWTAFGAKGPYKIATTSAKPR